MPSSSQQPVSITRLLPFGTIVCLLILAISLSYSVVDDVAAVKDTFDQRNLRQLIPGGDSDSKWNVQAIRIQASGGQAQFVNPQLLGLRQDRYAYTIRQAEEVIAIVVPATAEDGFNGFVDLLIAVDMRGRILAARLLRDIAPAQLSGTIDVIDSQWMREFDGSAMRNIRQISWQTIDSENEYDQFVGASLTPKSVSDRIYNAMVFAQSNRISLLGKVP